MDRLRLSRSRKERPPKQQPPEPQKLLTTSPVEYIENHIVPVGTSEHIYDRDQKTFVVVNRQTAPEKRTLINFYSSAADAQQQFAQKTPIDQPQSRADDMWDDVYMTIEDAVARYQNVGTIRESLRKLSKNAPTIQSWMALFPSSSYTSTLCGGIKFILDAAFKISKIRDEVLSMLAQIPDRIAKTKIAISLYDKPGIETAERLHEKSSDLYVAILDAVSLMVHWLNTKAEKKFFKSVFQGPTNYGDGIKSKLEDIEKIANDFWIEADLCLHHKVSLIHDGVDLVRSGVEKYGGMLMEMGGQNKQHFDRLHEGRLAADSRLTEIQEGIKGQEGMLNKLDQKSGAFLNQLAELLGGFMKNRKENQGHMRIASRKTFSRDNILLDLLQTRPDPIVSDLKLCFERALSASVVEIDCANFALNSTAFKTWISWPFSRILLVNGNSDATFISPMSHLCAFVAESLKVERIPSGIYFCGLRCTSDGGGHPGGPLDLVKSLIVQLMWRFNFDLEFVDEDPPDEDKLNAGEWLCSLLEKLVKQLPAGTVLFWIVDGVSYFERHQIVETTCRVFRELVKMIEARSDVIVKFLVTSPHRSDEVGRILGAQNTLNLPEVADGDRQGVFAMGLREAASMVPR